MVNTTPPIATVVSPMARHGWLAAAFLLSFLAVGSMHWTLPYSEVSLPNSLLRPALIGVLIAAVLARIIADTATDPTSHNLWPFELLLGGMVSTACAVAGSLVSIPWLKKERR